MGNEFTCSAAGDVLLQRMLPRGGDGYDGFETVRDFICGAELRLANLETTVHRYECPPTFIGGGEFMCARPETLEVVKAFGFNMLCTANNHALDFTQDGTVKTLEYLDRAGLAHVGTGRNMAEAAAPVYLDCPNGRYAVVAAATVYREYEMAGEQTRNLMGRPGINGLRYETRYRIRREQMETLRAIAAETAMNGAKDISRAEGFSPALQEGEFWFGGLSFYESDTPARTTHINKLDLRRVLDAVDEARCFADYVAVTFHSHDLEGTKKENPDMYLREFARACIDAGADAVIGHGPHLLRPIEIYKGRPIFYSLGNFITMNDNVTRAPKQLYEKYGVDPSANMRELYMAISANESRGLRADRTMMEAAVPFWRCRDGRLTELLLLPIDMGYGESVHRGGWPRFAPGQGIIERLADMSAPYGTKIRVREDGLGTVEWEE